MTNKNKVYEWIRILQKDPENSSIQELIVNHYKGLVKSLAYKYSANRLIHEDLVQVGMIGLLSAIQRFDKSYGKSFEAYAIPTILGEIKRFIRDQTWSVHVPRRIKELVPKIQRAVEELTIIYQKSPTTLEIARYLNEEEKDVLEALEMRRSYRALSIDWQIERDGEGGTLSILDVKGERDEQYSNVDQHLLIERILPILSEREQVVLKCVFFQEMSQKETGELLGISQMHVSRIQRRSLRKLRNTLPMSKEEILES